MTETCEYRLGHVNGSVYCARETREMYQALPDSVDFKAPEELWNPLSKAVVTKCSFVWFKGPVNI